MSRPETTLSTEIFALLDELHELCCQRGYDLALTEALAEEGRTIQQTIAALRPRQAMETRILTCLEDYHGHLLAQGALAKPDLTQDLDRFRYAFNAFTWRVNATSSEIALVERVYHRYVRKVATLARQGVV